MFARYWIRPALLVLSGLAWCGASGAEETVVPEPLRTFSPATSTVIQAKLSYNAFKGLELDEVDQFDGWTASAELLVPFMERFQLRVNYPFRTEGDARVREDEEFMPGAPVDVKGNGGVFDFLTITFEHELWKAGENGRSYGLGYYVGGGAVPAPLETDKLRFKGGYDFINHNGVVFHGGLKFDRQHGAFRGLGNAGLRYYTRSDDLNPGQSDIFMVVDLRAALVFTPWGRVHPAVELTYLGDFSGMNHFSVIPQLLLSLGDHFQLKGGVEVGLGGNGNELGGQAQMVVRF